MAFQKYTGSEKIEVVRGKEADVLTSHTRKLGKSVSDFSKDEKAALDKELSSVRETPDAS